MNVEKNNVVFRIVLKNICYICNHHGEKSVYHKRM